MCQKKNNLNTNNMLNLVCCRHHMEVHTILKMSGITNIQKNAKLAYVHPKQIQGYYTYRILIKLKIINMPPNKRIIEPKCFFKNKRDMQFRAGLVVRGKNQISGVDFTNKY